ncbi:hypothetical protein NOR_06821 [Metarhizium rileyi]|uniref:Uncharacterized protein n=1 Tax=Metarhizium rileyi (strain RCEF 4871) TaxID=1649241 RepID=A0A166ZN04_METRR|nr:hypothetical protein NOR_06821 [Metarhizium rileyi RCEF 4871]
MIRSAARLLPADSSLALNKAPHLLRPRAFRKRLDKNNEIYYTRVRKGLAYDPDPEKEYDFFEMPNLLLDLDAEGTRHVRSVADADETSMATKWAASPRYMAVKSRLKAFEEQLYESRKKVQDVLTQPTNIWRITRHDIVSAALQGPSDAQRKPARESTPAAIISGTKNTSISSGNAALIEKLRLENGIPPHAVDDDQLLLHWMTLRYKGLRYKTFHHKSLTRPSQKRQLPVATVKQLKQALRAQRTIVGVRRLVFQALSAGVSTVSFQNNTKSAKNLPQQLRFTCAVILGRDDLNRDLYRQTLTFLGNLSERLSSQGVHLGPILCGLALKLSAEMGSLEASSGWLNRTYQIDSKGEFCMEDVLSALTSLENSLRDQGPVTLQTVEQRQLLFQLLTGIDENNTMATDSFRSFGATFLLNQSSPDTARRVYYAYIALLGHLGAARTLWREWRELPAAVSKDGDVVLGFCHALKRAIHVMPALDGESAPNVSLDECATLDYHAIETQDPVSWLPRSGGDMAEPVGAKLAAYRSILALPLKECIKGVGTW